MYLRRWVRPYDCVEQVANADDTFVDLTPASQAPADAVKAAWAPIIDARGKWVQRGDHPRAI